MLLSRTMILARRLPSRLYHSSPLSSAKFEKFFEHIGEAGQIPADYVPPSTPPAPIEDLDEFIANLEWIDDGPEQEQYTLKFDPALPTAPWQRTSLADDSAFTPHLTSLTNALIKSSGLTVKQLDASWQSMIGVANAGRHSRGDKVRLMGDLFNADAIGGTKIDYGAHESLAALRWRFVRNYTVARSVMTEIKTLVPDFEPVDVLDFGCGAGPSSVAALRTFDGIHSAHGVDTSRSQREAYEIMTESVLKSKHVKARHVTVSSAPVFRKKRGAGGYDLVMASYVCHEMVNTGAILQLVRDLYAKLNKHGMLVMIEPGTPLGYRNVMLARKLLLNLQRTHTGGGEEIIFEDGWGEDDRLDEQFKGMSYKEVEAYSYAKAKATLFKMQNDPMMSEKAFDHEATVWEEEELEMPGGMKFHVEVVAPCMHRGECPLFNEREEGGGAMKFCSFEQRVITKDPNTPKEKYAYIVMKKVDREELEGKEEFEVEEDWEEEEGQEEEGQEEDAELVLGRLVRNPRKRARHVVMSTCAPSGEIVTQTVSKGKMKGKDKLSLYRSARKANWGGLYPTAVGRVEEEK